MTEEELREALRVHGFSSLNEFLDMRDKICTTSSEIKHKLLREELANEEESKEKSEEEEEIWCTECPYFEDVMDEQCIANDITAPHATRFGQQAIEPLQGVALPP